MCTPTPRDDTSTVELIPTTAQLEDATRAATELHPAKSVAWEGFLTALSPLAAHNAETYAHSLRVGLYASALARQEGLDDLMALYGGCGHDLGKVAVANEILRATDFGPAERVALRDHPRVGYEMLRDRFFFAALIAGLHHTFQPDPYGIDLSNPEIPPLYAGLKETLLSVAQLVAECDFYDALTTRPRRDATPFAVTLAEHINYGPRREWLISHNIATHGIPQ